MSSLILKGLIVNASKRSTSLNIMKVIIGVPINKQGSFVLDKFLKNQEIIKKNTITPTSLIFTTDEVGYVEELKSKLNTCQLDFEIITFDLIKPIWSKNRIWSITQARESIRKYSTANNADYLIFFDCDMVYENTVINDLINKAETGFDVVFNSYLLKNGKLVMNGFGGTLINRKIVETVPFRCYQTRKGDAVIDEGFYFEMDSLKKNAKIFRGIIADSIHFCNQTTFLILKKRPLTSIEKIKSLPLMRITMAKFVENKSILIGFLKIGQYLYRYS